MSIFEIIQYGTFLLFRGRFSELSRGIKSFFGQIFPRTKLGRIKNTGDHSNKSELVSVIIPVFNESRHLRDCIESIRVQTYENVEIILVDDGSNDRELDEVLGFLKYTKNLRIYRHFKNLGLPAARNTGVSKANGAFIQFLDSDDMLARWAIASKVELFLRFQKSHDVAGAALGVVQVREEFSRRDLGLLKRRQSKLFYVDSLSHPLENAFSVHEPMITIDSVRGLGGFDESMTSGGEDFDFWTRFFLSGQTIVASKTPSAIYRQKKSGMIHSAVENHSKITMEVIEKYKNRYLEVRVALARNKRKSSTLGLLAAKKLPAEKSMNEFNLNSMPFHRIRDFRRAFRNGFIRGLGLGPLEVKTHLDKNELDEIEHKADLFEIKLKNFYNLQNELGNTTDLLDLELPNRQTFTFFGSSEKTAQELEKDLISNLHSEDGVSPTTFGSISNLKLENKHRGETAIIIGNGPSLNRVNLANLQNLGVCFGVNGIYLANERLSRSLDYFVIEDTKFFAENIREIEQFTNVSHKLFPAEYDNKIQSDQKNAFFRLNYGYYGRGTEFFEIPRFSLDPNQRLYAGQSVTHLNLQLALFMGFKKVVLVGMDFEYSIPSDATIKGNHISHESEDPNHFDGSYFGYGKTWKDPKLDNVKANYELVKKVYESRNVEIVNSTVGGKLEVFKREALPPSLIIS